MARLERNSDYESWLKTLSNCIEHGLFTQEEVDAIINADYIEDYLLHVNLRDRLFKISPNKLAFGRAYKILYLQLVKDGYPEWLF